MRTLASMMLALTMVFAYGCDDDSMGDEDAGPGGGVDAGPGGGMDAGPGGGSDAGPGSDGGNTGDDGGTGSDGSAGDDGGNTMTDGGGGGTVGIACGMDTCDPATQKCCTTFGGPGTTSSMCVASDAMCMGTAAACDGPEDCSGGDVCCAQSSGSGGFSFEMTCVAAAMCEGGGFTGPFELCHTMADCNTTGDMCCPTMIIPGVDGTCREMCGFTMP